MTKRGRKSFSVRLQPYEGSPMAEVAEFLNALDDREKLRRVEDVLVMCLLPYARLWLGEADPEELRRACLEACDAMDKHASTLRQTLRVELPQAAVMQVPVVAGQAEVPQEAGPQPQIQSQVDTQQVESLFGN